MVWKIFWGQSGVFPKKGDKPKRDVFLTKRLIDPVQIAQTAMILMKLFFLRLDLFPTSITTNLGKLMLKRKRNMISIFQTISA